MQQCIVLYKLSETGVFSLRMDLALKFLVSRHLDSIHEHLCRLSRVVKADLDGTIFAYESEGRSKERFTESCLYSLVQYDLLYLNLQS